MESKVFTAKVRKFRRITIPKNFAEKFNIEEGDLVDLKLISIYKGDKV